MKLIYQDTRIVEKFVGFLEPCLKLIKSFSTHPSTHIEYVLERERRLLSDPKIRQLIREIPRTPENALKLEIISQILDSGQIEAMTSSEIAKLVGRSSSAIRKQNQKFQQIVIMHSDEIFDEYSQEDDWGNNG